MKKLDSAEKFGIGMIFALLAFLAFMVVIMFFSPTRPPLNSGEMGVVEIERFQPDATFVVLDVAEIAILHVKKVIVEQKQGVYLSAFLPAEKKEVKKGQGVELWTISYVRDSSGVREEILVAEPVFSAGR